MLGICGRPQLFPFFGGRERTVIYHNATMSLCSFSKNKFKQVKNIDYVQNAKCKLAEINYNVAE